MKKQSEKRYSYIFIRKNIQDENYNVKPENGIYDPLFENRIYSLLVELVARS